MYSGKCSVTAGIMIAVITAVSYILYLIFLLTSHLTAEQKRGGWLMYAGSQAETVRSCRLKIRSQQALVLMTVSLDNSPVSQSLQPGKINGMATLKCHRGKFERSVLSSPYSLLLVPFSFHWVTTRGLWERGAGRGAGAGGVEEALPLLSCTYCFTFSFCSCLCQHPPLCSLCVLHNSPLTCNTSVTHGYSYSGLACLLQWKPPAVLSFSFSTRGLGLPRCRSGWGNGAGIYGVTGRCVCYFPRTAVTDYHELVA